MKNILFWLLIFGFLFSGCEKKNSCPQTGNPNQDRLRDTAHVYPGIVRIKVTSQMAELLSVSTSSAKEAFAGLEIHSVHRAFPYTGKFEARTREAGLHLWYTVTLIKITP